MHCYNRSLMYRNVETCTMKIDLVKQLFQFFDQTDTEYWQYQAKIDEPDQFLNPM